MESKLEAHDASFEDVKRRLGVLEDAPVQSGIDEKVKSAISTEMKNVYDLIPGQIEQTVEDKIAVNHEDKMTKMIEINEVNSTRLINQLITHAKFVHRGNHSSENKTFVDYDPAGQPSTYLTTNNISQHPFNTSCDTRGQLDANSFMELKFGNKCHILCVGWAVRNALNRPYLADMEPGICRNGAD